MRGQDPSGRAAWPTSPAWSLTRLAGADRGAGRASGEAFSSLHASSNGPLCHLMFDTVAPIGPRRPKQCSCRGMCQACALKERRDNGDGSESSRLTASGRHHFPTSYAWIDVPAMSRPTMRHQRLMQADFTIWCSQRVLAKLAAISKAFS